MSSGMRGLLVPRLPSGGSHDPLRPPGPRLSKRDRVGLRLAVAAIVIGIPANFLWSITSVPISLFILLLIVTAPFELPHVAFGSIAAIIFALGCYLRWPPVMARLSPARRGLALLALVFVLHGIWFQFGWVPFRPLCKVNDGFVLGYSRSLSGPLTPEAASRFVEILQRQYSDGATQLIESNRILVRPAIALFGSKLHWNYTSRIAVEFGGARASDSCASVEQALMAGGQASSRSLGRGTWPWSTFDENGAVVQWLLALHEDR